MIALGLLVVSSAWAKEAYQRVVPPPTVVPGLRKVVVVEVGDPWDQLAQKQIAEAVRTRLGYSPTVPEADAGLRSDVLDFAMVPGSAVMGAGDIGALAAQQGAQLVVFAEGDGRQTAYETYQEERKRVEGEGEARREVKYNVPCARRDVEASWAAKVYSGTDGSQVAADGESRSMSDRDCDEQGDDPLKVKDADEMIGDLVGSAWRIMTEVAPRWEVVKVGWAKEESTRPAIDAADANDWATAVEMSVTTLADDPYNAAAVYHVGLALELHGHAAQAADLYKFASRMKDNAIYVQALTRARLRVTELATLADAYGQRVQPTDYPVASQLFERARRAAEIPVAGTPITVKGAKNKRIPVFASADSSGAPVALVPGGTDVRQIGASGAMVQVQLPDGAQGFVDAKALK